MTVQRGDEARRLVADRRLSSTAVEQVIRNAFGRLPISLVERGRALLRRYFSSEPWGYDEAAALAGIVGPGSGWQSVTLDSELTLEWGWRGETFRVEVSYSPREEASSPVGDVGAVLAVSRVAGIADTFDGPVVPEVQPTPATIRFVTGPATVGSSPWYHSGSEVGDPRLRRLFDELGDDLAGVQLGPGFVALQLHDASRWHDQLLPAMLLVAELFAPPRPAAGPPDRALERAQAELGGLDPMQRRDLAFVRDALTSPDAAQRQVAVGLLSRADPFTAEFGWRVAMGDNSRAVRRCAVTAMAEAARPELRRWMERGLGDSDACIRYHAVVGLSRIGVEASRSAMEPLTRDDDARVRLAAQAALERRTPGFDS